eukprot:m.188096 g.188096  ORF g.188096 m.188096 type:complete len:328 (+) comp25634_c0_seq7:31-1014(+)
MKISDKIAACKGEPFISFEFYPPKTEKGVANLYARFDRMKAQEPLYCDITWGAGGATSDLTLEIATEMKKRGLESNMHLTCTNMEQSKIDVALKGCQEQGIDNIVALRGDPPQGQEKWEATEGGFSCALDLVKHIREHYKDHFCVSVSGYPEGHPNVIKKVEEGQQLSESEKSRVVTTEDGSFVCFDADYAKEIEYLKQKVDAGADLIITQMIFDGKLFGRFLTDCRNAGIKCPIVPGIMVLQSAGGFKRMTGFCKSRVPASLLERLAACGDNEDQVKELGAQFGSELCKELLDAGAVGLHFYCLNLEKVTLGILEKLGKKKPTQES